MTGVKLLVLRSNSLNHLTVWDKNETYSFKNFNNKTCLQIIYLIYK